MGLFQNRKRKSTFREFSVERNHRPPIGATMSGWAERVNLTDTQNLMGIGIWGDSAPTVKADAVYLVLFNVITGIFHQRFRFCCWSKRIACNCGCKGKHTFEDVYKVLVWAMQQWRLGIKPSKRHDGILFQDSKRRGDQQRAKESKHKMKTKGGVVEARGDWQFYKQVFGLTGWKAEGVLQRVCFRCFANIDTLDFRINSLSALWRTTIISHAGFMANAFATEGFVSVVFSLPGFIFAYILIDLMHAGELGVLQYLLGNIFYDMFKHVGGTKKQPATALGDLMFLIKLSSKSLGLAQSPINALTLSMIRVGGLLMNR
jgi:hypothetical protein